MDALPLFRYHPDPVATGSVVASSVVCACCGQARGYVYVGPVYALGDYQDRLCPWCIADGSAHTNLGATFTDEPGIGGYGDWDSVPDRVIDEVANRTPSFSAWQQEQWWTHCSDAGQFVGIAGKEELEALGLDAVAAIQKSAGLVGIEWDSVFSILTKNGSPTSYIFRCTHCGTYGGYWDCD